MVIVVEAGPGELPRLAPGEHPEGDAGLHLEVLHRPRRAPKPARTCALVGLRHAAPMQKRVDPRRPGLPSRRHHLLDGQEVVNVDPRLVVDALRAVLAVLRAAPGLDAEQGAHLHLVARVVAPVDRLRLEQEVIERPIRREP